MAEQRVSKIMAVAGLLSLASCASFNGTPDPVLDVRSVAAISPQFYPAAAHHAIVTENDKRAYRNRVITVYMAAMDARYYAFRRDLSRHLRGGNFGLEIATLGIGGVGTVWSKAATEINAATTFLTGSKGAFNKEVYLQQTLPALVAMMDSNRLKIAGEILSKESRTIEEYPLEAAFSDLSRYELSASVDNAVQELTKEAALKADEVERRYQNLTASCGPTREAGSLRGQISDAAYNAAGFDDPDEPPARLPDSAQPGDLALIASVVGGSEVAPAATPEEASQQLLAVSDTLVGICEISRLQGLIGQINGRAERSLVQ